MQEYDNAVLKALSVIQDPDLGKDIVTLGFIKELKTAGGEVSFSIELTTPACPVKEEFRSTAERLVKALDWVKSVKITMTARPQAPGGNAKMKGLQRVRNVIAVSSCKGGVGKSTVAVNLAYSIARTGAKVGIFDADIYGPSLPSMVSPVDRDIYQNNQMIAPLEYEGVKLMSFGFVNSGDEAAIMRGPMVSQVIGQLLGGSDWEELDYLIVDFPPGTGDIQLTLLQQVPFSSAVVVTTPQNLSFVDVVKGLQMFEKLEVPVVAVVENMSYFTCGKCDEKHHPFGSGAARRLRELYGIRHSFELPIVAALSAAGDTGIPTVLAEPAGAIAKAFADISASVVRETERLRHTKQRPPSVQYLAGEGIVVSVPGEEPFSIAPATLRRACRCARCIDERTGEKILQDHEVDAGVHPEHIAPMGNYAVAMSWSDGHSSSIFPYQVLLKYK